VYDSGLSVKPWLEYLSYKELGYQKATCNKSCNVVVANDVPEMCWRRLWLDARRNKDSNTRAEGRKDHKKMEGVQDELAEEGKNTMNIKYWLRKVSLMKKSIFLLLWPKSNHSGCTQAPGMAEFLNSWSGIDKSWMHQPLHHQDWQVSPQRTFMKCCVM